MSDSLHDIVTVLIFIGLFYCILCVFYISLESGVCIIVKIMELTQRIVDEFCFLYFFIQFLDICIERIFFISMETEILDEIEICYFREFTQKSKMFIEKIFSKSICSHKGVLHWIHILRKMNGDITVLRYICPYVIDESDSDKRKRFFWGTLKAKRIRTK